MATFILFPSGRTKLIIPKKNISLKETANFILFFSCFLHEKLNFFRVFLILIIKGKKKKLVYENIYI